MADRPCSVDGCDAPTGVPGTARGFCSSHYYRWKRYGDPTGSHQPRMRGCVCSVADCDRPVLARTWCATHYSRWRRHGTLGDVRPHANAPEGTKWCPTCRRYASTTDFYVRKDGGLESVCRPCARSARRAWVKENYQLKVRTCSTCGIEFASRTNRWRHCSDTCAGRSHASRNAIHTLNRRALLAEAYVEDVDPAIVMDRDGWLCGICSGVIDPSVRWPNPGSASVDHVQPLARGGEHSYANCQASHLGCNCAKSDREEVRYERVA